MTVASEMLCNFTLRTLYGDTESAPYVLSEVPNCKFILIAASRRSMHSDKFSSSDPQRC